MGDKWISKQLVAALIASRFEKVHVLDVPLMRHLRLFDEKGELRSEQWSTPLKEPVDFVEWTEETDPEDVDCIVATSDFGGARLLRELNRFCIEHKRSYLPVTLYNGMGRVGPLVVPYETACYECFYARANSHLVDQEMRQAIDDAAFAGQPFTGFHPSMASILGDFAAMELTKFYSGSFPPNTGVMVEVNLIATQVTKRKVLKVPRCVVCSSLSKQSSTNVQKKVFNPLVPVIK
jgi:thiazole/oxazole-forming peptide maturase SagC family component